MVHPSQQQHSYSAREARWSLTLTSGRRARTFAVRPWTLGLAGCSAGLFLSVYLAATGYLVYRDGFLGAAISRQIEMQYAYEDRIAALRSELDRVTSRHVVQTEGVEQQLARLLERQALIERRQSALHELSEKARAAGLIISAFNEEQTAAGAGVSSSEPRNLEPLLTTVQSSLDAASERQDAALTELSATADGELGRVSAALAPVGIKTGDAGQEEPQGGPFVPVAALHFVEQATLLGRTLDELAALRRSAEALPLGVPVSADRISGRYGYRLDPFLNRPAFHAGIDLAAPKGTNVYATAPGIVTSAGWQGGYGKMVEIRHAEGLTTRYGHLSEALVSPGDEIGSGTLIGRVGSTGRSTGPHLHYETRRDGDALNPAIFLSAGRALRR